MRPYEPATRELDLRVGMLVYAAPEAYVPGVIHRKGPDTFAVTEVHLTGEVADPSSCVDEAPMCSGGRTPIYVLCKSGVPTLGAVGAIKVSLPFVRSVGYAGLKDAEARACQFISLRCARDVRLPGRLEGRGFSACFTGRYGWLRRGDLLGNRFSALLEGGVKGLGDASLVTMYPNFFGYQRFGTRRPVTHLVGKALVEGRCWDALELIAGTPSEGESPRAREAREAFMEGRYAEAARRYPRGLFLERGVASALAGGASCGEVLERVVGKWLKGLFVEALQSYLFNLALSEMVMGHGSLKDVARACEVLPLPSPFLRGGDECSEVSRRVFEEGVEQVVSGLRGLWRRSVRPTYFVPEDVSIDYLGAGEALLKFFLGPSTYASVMIREIVRDMLIFR